MVLLTSRLPNLEVCVESEDSRRFIMSVQCLYDAPSAFSTAESALFPRGCDWRTERLPIAAVLDLVEVDRAEGCGDLNALHTVWARVEVGDATALLSCVQSLHWFCSQLTTRGRANCMICFTNKI